MKAYIVWNNNQTVGFVTKEHQLAYEARKGAASNCYKENGTPCELAMEFCELYSCEEDCTIQVVEIEGI